MRQALQKAKAAVLLANRVVIGCHVNPDGDTLGCALALMHALRSMGKQADVLSADGVPVIYRWMPGASDVMSVPGSAGYDLAILCDTSGVERAGSSAGTLASAPVSICIDHHITEGKFGDIRVVNPKAAATGEIVYQLLVALGAEMDQATASCLMCAIVTDTGVFRFMNVTPTTFRVSEKLMRLGASPAEVCEQVFDNRSIPSVKLLGGALSALRVSPDGTVAWTHISARDFADAGATDEDTEGVVSHVRAIEGVKVGILFREIPNGGIRVSLRSRAGASVSEVAAMFGGGGHKMAAGCTLHMPLAEAEATVLSAVGVPVASQSSPR